MNAMVFQSAYSQISTAERHFVDRIVDALAEAARIAGQSIRYALGKPLPAALRSRDTHGRLDRPLVQAAISEKVLQRADADEITAERWIREVIAIATFDLTDYFTTDAMGIPVLDVEGLRSAEQSGAIKQIDVEMTDNLTRSNKVKMKVVAHVWGAYLGLDDGENPHRRADRAAQDMPAITESTTATEAGEAYARLIGDDA